MLSNSQRKPVYKSHKNIWVWSRSHRTPPPASSCSSPVIGHLVIMWHWPLIRQIVASNWLLPRPWWAPGWFSPCRGPAEAAESAGCRDWTDKNRVLLDFHYNDHHHYHRHHHPHDHYLAGSLIAPPCLPLQRVAQPSQGEYFTQN